MDDGIKYEFMERFNSSVKLEFCVGICQIVMESIVQQEPENVSALKKIWEANIRERFKLNVDLINQHESVSEEDMKFLEGFLESLLGELKLIEKNNNDDQQKSDMEKS